MIGPTAKPRWFCPTPGWLILALLVVEGLLWQSEKFQWFDFNEHKGYTVLFAVASAAVAMILMLFWFAVALLFSLRFQFGIRSLLTLTVTIAIPCSWLAVEKKQSWRQREAAAAFGELSGNVAWGGPSGPEWAWSLLGEDFFKSVYYVNLGNTQVTDAGLESLKGLSQLESLGLDGTKITDAGLIQLKGLSQLHELYLFDTKVTDSGLEHLKGLNQLKMLFLHRTKVTDEGVKKLQQALPNCRILR